MKAEAKISWCIIALLAILCVEANHFAPADYARQFRDYPNAPPSRHFLLGTDDLGRDRLSRVLYGGRVSLLMAPAAALVSAALAAVVGIVAGYFGGYLGRIVTAIIDLFLSMPWFFLLITVRAALPLNVSPLVSASVTFLILGLLGWAASARVVCAGARALRQSDFIIGARAFGCSRLRILLVQLVPNLKPTLWAQFVVSIPAFILAEANLTMLGLGVSEPLPSWGSLLKELEGSENLFAQPWRLAPLLMLGVVVFAFQFAVVNDEVFT